MWTPWGKSDSQHSYGNGVTFYGTPQHGGIKLSAERNKLIPETFRNENGWYEEDVESNIVVLTFPELFTPEWVNDAPAMLKDYFPHQYEEAFNVKLDLSESYILREEYFDKEHVNDFVSVAAWGNWSKDVPDGMVGLLARRKVDGAEEYFLVPADSYHNQAIVIPWDAKIWDRNQNA